MSDENLLMPKTARELAAAGAIREGLILPEGEGWRLVFRVGMVERTLRVYDAARPRIFKQLETAAATGRKLGLARVTVEMANWDPDDH